MIDSAPNNFLHMKRNRYHCTLPTIAEKIYFVTPLASPKEERQAMSSLLLGISIADDQLTITCLHNLLTSSF
ncbi:hypothetical protein CsSME_00020512 [Camellia sinensis var. sinensis]